MEGIHAFPDTNIFLHFPPLGQVDWCKLLGAKTVELVICLQVIHELDDKKGDSRFSERAERAIKEMREYHKSGEPLRPGVTLRIYNKDVRAEDVNAPLNPALSTCIFRLAEQAGC